MRILSVKSALVFSGMLALSACATGPRYETITSTAATTSPLTGTALRFNTTGGSIIGADVVEVAGSLTHNTGRISISDGTYLLVDPNGFDLSGVITNGTVTGLRLDGAGTGLFDRTYEYVLPVQYSYVSGGSTIFNAGVIGIATRAADVPVSGAAQYTGEAAATYISADGLTEFLLSNGISIVDVNFAAGTVDATVGLFTRINGVNGLPTASPVDAVSGTGMTIVGASFSGGTWITFKDGAPVSLTGASTTVEAGGDFYGYDPSTSGPAEVAGVFLMDGNSATVYGIFIAE